MRQKWNAMKSHHNTAYKPSTPEEGNREIKMEEAIAGDDDSQWLPQK